VVELRGFLLRFLLIATIAGFAAVVGERWLAQTSLPLFKTELAYLDDTFRIDALYIDRDGADQVVRVDVGLARPLSLNGRTYYPDPRGRATASTLVGNLTLPCGLLLAVALAWPVRNGGRLPLRLLALGPGLLLMAMLGIPFILWGALWGVVLQIADPNRFSLPVMWSDILVGGGNFALAIMLGAGIGSIAARRCGR
jgi:hypothetical protein